MLQAIKNWFSCNPPVLPVIPNSFELSSPDHLKTVFIEVKDGGLIIHNYHGFGGFCVPGDSEDLARLKEYLGGVQP